MRPQETFFFRAKGAAALTRHRHLEQLRDAQRVAEWRAATVLRPTPGPPTRDRWRALIERVRLKEAAANQGGEMLQIECEFDTLCRAPSFFYDDDGYRKLISGGA